jgi:AcrR family transcriptional regulator
MQESIGGEPDGEWSRVNGSDTTEQDGIVELLWGEPNRPSRGPRPSLSISAIAEATMLIADADGLAAVSMQRVAEALGVTKMALYRYVAGKAQLLAVTIEAAVGERPDLGGAGPGWRSRIEEWARLLRETWQRHPWLPDVTVGDRVMGPREVAWIECPVAVLAEAGLTGPQQMDAVLLLCAHVRNTLTASASGTQPWTPGRGSGSLRAQLVEREADYAAVLAATRSGASPDNGWRFGLDLVLDGLDVLIGEAGAGDTRAARARR